MTPIPLNVNNAQVHIGSIRSTEQGRHGREERTDHNKVKDAPKVPPPQPDTRRLREKLFLAGSVQRASWREAGQAGKSSILVQLYHTSHTQQSRTRVRACDDDEMRAAAGHGLGN